MYKRIKGGIFFDMKRLAIVCLVFLIVSFSVSNISVYAVDKNEALNAANELHALGLFNGVGTNSDGTPIYNLGVSPTRNQAVIMLVRLLGKENMALANAWYTPFEDVDFWSTSSYYIGYAYNHGLTNGTSDTTYGGTGLIKSNQYIAFVLRALGYKSPDDFTVSKAAEFADNIGLTHGEYSDPSMIFTRGDVALISRAALDVKMANGGTIREQIHQNKVSTDEPFIGIDIVKYDSYGLALKQMVKSPQGIQYLILDEIKLDSADVASYAYIDKDADGNRRCNYGVSIIYIDGNVYRLPLPEDKNYLRCPALSLRFDRDKRLLQYDAGEYIYTYDLETQSISTVVNKNIICIDNININFEIE